MPTSSLPKPLRPTYRIERQLIDEHNMRLKMAHATWGGRPVCPDCYKPHTNKRGAFQCELINPK